MREQTSVKTVPKNIEALGKEDMTEEELLEERTDLTRFISLKNSRLFNVIEIIKTDPDERTKNSQFYLEMYLKTQVTFFAQFDKTTFRHLCSCMKLRKFKAGEMLTRKGQKCTRMLIIMQGAVGVY
jgi:hypothetical protein